MTPYFPDLSCKPDCGCEGLVKRYTYLNRCDWNTPDNFVEQLEQLRAMTPAEPSESPGPPV